MFSLLAGTFYANWINRNMDMGKVLIKQLDLMN
jgi:hypothetical protein